MVRGMDFELSRMSSYGGFQMITGYAVEGFDPGKDDR